MRFDDLSTATRADAEAVADALSDVKRLGVAYSGGVDSAVLLALSVRVLGRDRALGLLADSPSLARHELQIARSVAAQLGADVVEFATHEGDRPQYRANGADRCFYCKDELFTVISETLAEDLSLDAVAYGENADDAKRLDRPGAEAATRHRVLRPLAQAGITKARVRALAHDLGLSVADKPAAPCLASRIPHGEQVTPEKLRQVETAEQVLRDLGFSDSRVRHHGKIARIEVPLAEIGRFADDTVREQALRAIRASGFAYVTIDLAGMQSGAFTMQIITRHD
ncbi:MAG: ATP-dependent sacrificial sulfur transferase LarE [Propionibacteriaceae bacterium]|uniref:ATP-dependent sacrificial sulfur transferase LarE n=1 Tax=Brooklawnia propionicigenes TaxID=3041175 RepID=UPI001699E7E0|nr:ATP-dependent sacrificial sulfur transferase LarE [Brooklawnia sp. SH051]MCB0884990.1 ATP-dependent sacrificial sulfur transferase LarE [Propionibacteriaceae bacterium]NLI83795.1 ATP-dependent sacrificial sulfur transferase LarE [Propionibacterium sp.]